MSWGTIPACREFVLPHSTVIITVIKSKVGFRLGTCIVLQPGWDQIPVRVQSFIRAWRISRDDEQGYSASKKSSRVTKKYLLIPVRHRLIFVKTWWKTVLEYWVGCTPQAPAWQSRNCVRSEHLVWGPISPFRTLHRPSPLLLPSSSFSEQALCKAPLLLFRQRQQVFSP